MNSKKKVILEITSCYEHISLLAQGVTAMVKCYVQAEEIQGRIELCLVEVANNVVEHSYHGQDSHSITLEITLSVNEITLLVIDSGDSIPDGNLSKTVNWDDLDKDNICSLETSGRGLQIVKELMDDVSYWTEPEFNYFKMVKKIS